MNVTLGVKNFKEIAGSTIEHDYWVMALIRRAGLDELTIGDGESAEDFALRVFREAIESDQVFLLLGGMMMPAEAEPVSWTPKMAQDTADFIRRLSAPQDKREVQRLFMSLLEGFFVSGLASVRTSPNSSWAERDSASPSKTGVH